MDPSTIPRPGILAEVVGVVYLGSPKTRIDASLCPIQKFYYSRTLQTWFRYTTLKSIQYMIIETTKRLFSFFFTWLISGKVFLPSTVSRAFSAITIAVRIIPSHTTWWRWSSWKIIIHWRIFKHWLMLRVKIVNWKNLVVMLNYDGVIESSHKKRKKH